MEQIIYDFAHTFQWSFCKFMNKINENKFKTIAIIMARGGLKV